MMYFDLCCWQQRKLFICTHISINQRASHHISQHNSQSIVSYVIAKFTEHSITCPQRLDLFEIQTIQNEIQPKIVNDIMYTGDNTYVHKMFVMVGICQYSSDRLTFNVCRSKNVYGTYFSHVFHGFIVNGSRIYTLFKNPLLLYNSSKTVDFYQVSWHQCDIPLYHGSTFVWFGKV